MAKFLILSEKSGEASIYLRVQRRKTDDRKALNIIINTRLQTNDADMWRKCYDVTGKNDKFMRDNKALFDKLGTIRDAVDSLINSGVYDKASIDKAVSDIAFKEINEQRERMLQRKEQEVIKAEQEQQAQRLNVLNYYKEFYKGICNGDIRHGNDERYRDGSLHVWREFGVYLAGFCAGKHITFDTIDKKTADGFSKYLEVEIGLMPKTITKYIICFRKLCNHAAEAGINRNAVSLKVWKERRVKDSNMRVQTYLNEEELTALYNMKLTGTREKVRDMFLLGTLLCQRYSDYMSLYQDNFAKPLDDGTKCCRLTQQKTGASVVIPFYDDRIEAICNKYGYHFPHNRTLTGEGKERYMMKSDGDFTLQAFNRYIKDIMKLLSKDVPSLNDMFITVLTASERRCEDAYKEKHGNESLYRRNDKGEVIKPKWDVITAHSARRSGITCLYNKHALTNREIMQISGHASELIFEHYIKTGSDEMAMNINKKLREP
jgi:site-specific recombinase XerD